MTTNIPLPDNANSTVNKNQDWEKELQRIIGDLDVADAFFPNKETVTILTLRSLIRTLLETQRQEILECLPEEIELPLMGEPVMSLAMEEEAARGFNRCRDKFLENLKMNLAKQHGLDYALVTKKF